MNPQQVAALIHAGLAGSSATVTSPDNVHFEATVVSSAFAGKRAVQRHQLVYATLGPPSATRFMPWLCRCSRRKSSRCRQSADGQTANSGRHRARRGDPHLGLQERHAADFGRLPARRRTGDGRQRAAPARRHDDDRVAGAHGRIGDRRREDVHRGRCIDDQGILRSVSARQDDACLDSGVWARYWRVLARRMSRCRADAQSARARSISTSRACRPWARIFISRTAISRRGRSACTARAWCSIP